VSQGSLGAGYRGEEGLLTGVSWDRPGGVA